MTHSILDAITTQLGITFGDSYKYYMENVEQHFKTPCFTVDLIQPMQRSKSPVLYERTMPVIVHYFHNDRTAIKRTAYTIAERLMECLEYLPFEGTILRGENMSWRIEDDVLQAFITYRFTTTTATTEEPMENLDSPEIVYAN